MQAAGQKVPALENRPELSRWTAPYFEAFLTLTDSRSIGFGGAGAIPLSEIKAYCDLYQIDDVDEIDRLITMIKALDSEFLSWASEKKPKETAEAQRGLARNRMPARGGRRR